MPSPFLLERFLARPALNLLEQLASRPPTFGRAKHGLIGRATELDAAPRARNLVPCVLADVEALAAKPSLAAFAFWLLDCGTALLAVVSARDATLVCKAAALERAVFTGLEPQALRAWRAASQARFAILGLFSGVSTHEASILATQQIC